MKVEFLGHSCFLIETGGKRIIIDPFLRGNPLAASSPDDLGKIDMILLTHGHGDHFGDALEISGKHKSVIAAPNELAVYCQMRGAPVHPMHIGGAYDFGWVKVKLTQAFHGSSVIDENGIQYTGMPCGFLVTAEGKTVYHAGDTGLFGDMEIIGRMNRIDLALLPIGDNFVMGADDAVEASVMLAPGAVVPMHYNTFDLIMQDPEKFCKKVREKGIACHVMEPGGEIEI